MNLIRIQGVLFGVISIICLLASLFLPALDKQTELILVAALIIILGVPHGALDTLFARELYGVNSATAWIKFSVIYLMMAALVVVLWYMAPLLFLVGFIGISIAHFSGDPDGETGWLIRLIYGGAIIFIPVLKHPQEIADVFSLLVGEKSSQALMPWMSGLALPWLLALSGVVLYLIVKKSPLSFEFLCLGLIAYFVSPLISFTVFFCGMHSARHIIRTAAFAKYSQPVLLLGAMLLPMLGVIALSAVSWFMLKNQTLDGRVVQIVFVGLAA
ncbi:MAG: Brp/Blh family beta-carotene 15,15'-dioxygenase, partial [Opitutales bacterium]|nr:Brp/Blh family beta-carotene 15,15'-dioxygenase [Opitutales bacterium]